MKTANITQDIKDSFWSKVDKLGPEDCWDYRGYITKYVSKSDNKGYSSTGGYGIFSYMTGGKKQRKQHHLYAHRVAYELLVGEIPRGMTIHHKCFNPKCCNPSHLEVLTKSENARIKNPSTEKRKRKTNSSLKGMPRDQRLNEIWSFCSAGGTLQEYAERNCVNYNTAIRWFKMAKVALSHISVSDSYVDRRAVRDILSAIEDKRLLPHTKLSVIEQIARHALLEIPLKAGEPQQTQGVA